jgi:hypothetical protein
MKYFTRRTFMALSPAVAVLLEVLTEKPWVEDDSR